LILHVYLFGYGGLGVALLKIGIITGLAFERRVVARAARGAGVAGQILCASGLGHDQARRVAERVLHEGANALLSFGIAGGLAPDVECGTTIIATAIHAEGLNTLPCASDWTARLENALQNAGTVICASLALAPVILTTRADKARAFASTGAAAADMESYGVAEAARAAGVPFAAIRVVADTARENLPEIALYATAPDGSLRVMETLSRVLRGPGQIPGLVRLGRATAHATRQLEALAATGAPKLFFAENA